MLRVAILWHFHQPLYVNPGTGMASLPWVRLHGLKDYFDMAALAEAAPGLEVTFNMVPSLVDQLLDVAEGRTVDPALALARRNADSLEEEEQNAILDLFFSVPYRTLIAPFPRYSTLFHKRGGRGPDGGYAEAARRFKPRDYRDLMVWFHLAWSGETLKRRPEVRDLIRKGEGFTEEDKAALLALQQDFLKNIVPYLTGLAASGRIEISTTPYYHPILPLLCDSDSALEAAPNLSVPRPPFRRPGDASAQVRSAVERHREIFGVKPRGMWPSEGSLSEDAVRIISEEGIEWSASDEGILAAALQISGDGGWWGSRVPLEKMCAAWRLRGEGPALFFRDRELSDLVGFTYSGWDAEKAAEDFVSRIMRIRDSLGESAGDAIVPVILDGENAWEHYPDNGEEFLKALYRRLTGTEGITTTTFSHYLDSSPAPRSLSRIQAGSWIRSDFTTWIGHPEKNRGWDLLRAARDAYDRTASTLSEKARSTAWRCLQAAEGSDWFWWYGDEHSSEEDPIFDASFRELLKEMYSLIGEPAPEALSVPIMGRRRESYQLPTGPISPVLDGKRTDYFEWLAAGVCEASSGFGTMRPGVAPVDRVAFGWGPGHLYLRVDPLTPAAMEFMKAGDLTIDFTRPQKRRVVIRASSENSGLVADFPGVRCAAARVVEIAVPLDGIGAADGNTIGFSVSYRSGDKPVERLPRDGDIIMDAAPGSDWTV